jgi:hypothetical protein
VHDTWLTGAMVVYTCGIHQGARVISAYFRLSRDLQLVNKKRDKDADKGQVLIICIIHLLCT